MRRPVLLTGATGFLGTQILARLLEEGREVRAVIRASDQAGADRRLDEVLARLWEDPSRYRARVTAVLGDVTRPDLGMASATRDALLAEVGAVLHCAAAISFELPIAAARVVNVEGTRHVLAFAREVPGLERFLHVSTAYVAGTTAGRFRERQHAVGQAFRNTYEQAKWEAERAVAAAGELFPLIARPSIVVGEAASGWTSAFNVLYPPLRALSRGMLREVPADPKVHLDVVCVDYVADALVHLLDRREAGVVHLVAGDEARTVEEIGSMASAHFGCPAPRYVAPNAAPSTSADEVSATYFPYFEVDVLFDDVRAREVLAPAGIRPPRLPDVFGNLMTYAETAQWGKRNLTREAARERVATPA